MNTGSSMNSTLVKAEVFHQRFFPARHRFRYRVLVYCLDLDELDILDRRFWGVRHNRWGPAALYDSDYLTSGPGTLREKLIRLLSGEGIHDPIGRIRMITALRRLGRVFNPVSFYFCYTQNNAGLLCVVAEVNNTFGERHLYLLDKGTPQPSGGIAYTETKVFHVSPFNRISGRYHFQFGDLDRDVDIRITLFEGNEKKFIARLHGPHLPLDRKTHMQAVLGHPLTPHMTMNRILKEAGVLFFNRKLSYVPKPVDTHAMTIAKQPSNGLQRITQRLFLQYLKKIKKGRLEVSLPDGSHITAGPGGQTGSDMPTARLDILDYDFFPKTVFGGDIGFGESYMKGYFTTDSLTDLLGLFIRNFSGGKRPGRTGAFCSGVLARLIRAKEENTLTGSPKNIRRHYDMSNAFFRLFLDKSMTYSSAVFASQDDSLEEAQVRKLDRIIEMARISENDHVLEIGSGWGALAVRAVQQIGCRVTTITLSREQYAYVTKKIEALGLTGQITVLLEDYRTVAGQYDKIVSIEMLEAVGHRFLGLFFRRCHELLKPGGRVVIQVITLPDQEYAAYRLRLDWIQKYIFPGGHLPSLTALCRAMTQTSPLIVEELHNIGLHYALTLDHWHRRFTDRLDDVRALGFDEEGIRMWRFYLKSCQALFQERGLEDLQLVLTRPYEAQPFI